MKQQSGTKTTVQTFSIPVEKLLEMLRTANLLTVSKSTLQDAATEKQVWGIGSNRTSNDIQEIKISITTKNKF
jgi:hypothetical protein